MNESQHPTLIRHGLNAVLPLELVEAVNQSYFLHLLAINPEKVLPPGKSLISVVTQEKLGVFQRDHENKQISVGAIQQQVTNVMQAAFWDVTAEKLASPEPSEQNMHIKRLLNDIREAVSPLLPTQDQLIHLLSHPPPPSIAPLYSFLNVLKEVLTTLRRRCAPLRDCEIDAELQTLGNLPPKPSLTIPALVSAKCAEPMSPNAPPIARQVTQSLRATMTIIDHMKSDLHHFVLGTMTEEQLRSLVIREAKLRERDLVIKLWSPRDKKDDRTGEGILRESWRVWCRQCKGGDHILEEERWKLRLLMALTTPKPVSCIPPQDPTVLPEPGSSAQNVLPPQFFFSTISLYRLQDYMQAAVIAATLRSLIRLPTSTSLQSSPLQTPHDFIQRVWDLLNSELNATLDNERTGDSPLKLINLEDEVVRAWRITAERPNPSEEGKLREAVKRSLQSTDPVFLLLQKRLLDAILQGIVATPSLGNNARIPDRLKAGRGRPDEPAAKRLKLMFDEEDPANLQEITSSIVGLSTPVKGFEDPVLRDVIGEAYNTLAKIVGWIENVWGDLI